MSDPNYATPREPESRKWFDGTINIPTLLSVIAAAVGISVTGVGMYNTMDRRILTIEEHDKNQEAHFVRIENDAVIAKGDVKGQLDDIKQGQKDTNSKLDQLLFNQVGNRSAATQRWIR